MAADSLFLLSDLKTQVGLNLGATDDVSLAKAGKYINRALLRFSELGEWSWQAVYAQAFPGATAVTVASQDTYNVKGCLRIASLYMASPIQRRLVMQDDRSFRRMYPNATAVGTPYYYMHRGRGGNTSSPAAYDTLKVGLYPIPDAAYTLLWDGVRPITLLTADTDDVRIVTGMPVTLVDILIEMATAIGWKEIDDGDAAVQMQEVLTRLKAAYADDTHDIEDVHILAPFEGDALDKIFDPTLPPNFGE
jgi:hypothetical protein